MVMPDRFRAKEIIVTNFIHKPKEIKFRRFVKKPNIRQAVIIATEMLKFAEFDRIEEKYSKQLKDLLEKK